MLALLQRVRALVPDARVGVGHGQMTDEGLEHVMVAFMEGRIDVLWQGAPPPIPSLAQVLANAPATVFGLTEAEQAAMIKRFPFLTPATVPSGTYRGQAAPMRSAAGCSKPWAWPSASFPVSTSPAAAW